MEEKAKKHEDSLFSKIVIVASLPLIAFIWMTGWTLTFIGEKMESKGSMQKTLRIDSRFKSQIKNFEHPDEESKIATEAPIVA